MNKWVLKILSMILPLITPEIKNALCGLIKDLKERAAKTSNPWDDIVAELLEDLFCPK